MGWGQTWFTFLKPLNSINQFILSLCRRNLSYIIGENSVYPIVKATVRMRSITRPVHTGSPITKRNNF